MSKNDYSCMALYCDSMVEVGNLYNWTKPIMGYTNQSNKGQIE